MTAHPDRDWPEDDVALKLLHTADWHLGRRFSSFPEPLRLKLSRARLQVVERIFRAADNHGVHGVLCAGDLFDEPDPGREWWEPVAELLGRHARSGRPIFLLPGNHDPLVDGSVWKTAHAFRRGLPRHVHVVDQDDFEFAFSGDAVLYGRPCRSAAGQRDLALALPQRADGDERIRIGLVHGQTFDIEGYQSNFPIARDAALRRGLDYLAIGDTHALREVQPNTWYPGTPEQLTFGEQETGSVVLVLFSRRRRSRPMVHRERVAFWRWDRQICTTLGALEALRNRSDLARCVLDLRVEMRLPPDELDAAERLLAELQGTQAATGRVGALLLDRTGLELDTAQIDLHFEALPDVLRAAVARLQAREEDDPRRARRALRHLLRIVRDQAAAT